MSLSYRSLPIFLFFFLAVPLLWAQAAKTSIIIERQAVHFITPGEAVEWQLVISNQQGEVIFDSGLLAVLEGDTTIEEVVRCIRSEA